MLNWLFRRPRKPALYLYDDNVSKLSTGSVVYCERALPYGWRAHGGGL